MSQWRRTAIERFPHLHRAIADAENATIMWFELRSELEKAYRAAALGQGPLDEQFVADVYEYAHWCLYHRSIEVRTRVVIGFYEHLADTIILRKDVGRWLSEEDFDLLGFAWDYVLKDAASVEAFQRDFLEQRAAWQRIHPKRHGRNPAAKPVQSAA